MSWDDGLLGARASRPHHDGFLGARASRPHQAWHGLGCLPHLDRPGPAPWLSFGLADAVPADSVAACSIALKLSGFQRDRMRAGRPLLPGEAVPVVPWGVSGGRLLRKPTFTLWEPPVCPRAVRPPCRAVHSRKNGRSIMKTNHEWTLFVQKTDRPPSTTSGAKIHLQFCALGVTMSWDEGLL